MSILSLLSSILLGVIQGVTEFLPVSSSGHLAIAEHLLGMSGASEVPEFFDVLLHLGTLVAVFVAYWEDIRSMVVEFFLSIRDVKRHTFHTPLPPPRRLILLIIVGTLPLFVVLPVKDLVAGLGDNMYFVAGALLVTGCLLFASDRVKKGRKTEKSATMRDVLLVGIGQAVATCPGISRSGTTITAGCFVGFDRRFAVRYSFLMSIPAILGANILSLKDAMETVIWADVPVYLVGVAVSAVVGYACIRMLKMIADKGKFGFFAYYCWIVGVLTLVLTVIQK
ncbi:undecaprenyl-diphosphate phosphatase [uncultured Dysosmobacter sp.]|uniref:undecaprenyl-diphosphate phosphatase n=1 Tax=uncultured Dysosmobacter sp. TaxID=2591384 RepID=UPI00261DE974|nr:undecaprenyl-diphosphate phosphatase [uncultured Dysosmobacter sp.]